MKMRFALTLPFVLLTLLACDRDPSPPPDPVRPVVVRSVEPLAPEPTRTFSGAARAEVETVLSFRVPGEIIELPAEVGLLVDKGDVVARLDPTDYRLQVREAEAALARAEALFSRAQADYERARLLYETENISRAELDEARGAFRSARAQVSAAEESLALARRQLGYTTLRSPIEGGVAEVPVEVHQSIDAGTPIAILAGRGPLRFEIGVPEALIPEVRKGDPARVTFEARPGVSFAARVIEVGILARQLTVFPVTLRFEERDPRILPGMIGRAELTFPREAEARLPTLPPEAILPDRRGGYFVWIADPETETVSARAVAVGELVGGEILVTEGLHPGDLVVVRGAHRVEGGERVTLLREDEIQ